VHAAREHAPFSSRPRQDKAREESGRTVSVGSGAHPGRSERGGGRGGASRPDRPGRHATADAGPKTLHAATRRTSRRGRWPPSARSGRSFRKCRCRAARPGPGARSKPGPPRRGLKSGSRRSGVAVLQGGGPSRSSCAPLGAAMTPRGETSPQVQPPAQGHSRSEGAETARPGGPHLSSGRALTLHLGVSAPGHRRRASSYLACRWHTHGHRQIQGLRAPGPGEVRAGRLVFLLFPFYWMAIVSFKPTNDLFEAAWSCEPGRRSARSGKVRPRSGPRRPLGARPGGDDLDRRHALHRARPRAGGPRPGGREPSDASRPGDRTAASGG
jgi:hypothetical protein